ncbi:DUF4164 domain-containing protein [Paenibacillus sp. P96]|uniref:DUF4164 domain-containing protein n=1 Tax=Paenibacillus zeirhizosphaerae TaxID=2987519 RepID=A0ABT9FRC6_9BACL|nr:hypothetical protein [Paenibacillus sp. P96]MDP4096987.1 DUF4164 domain-containing protein [Paenibacillus sp. P96]
MIEWIVQHLYLVAVIVFALLSFLGKTNSGGKHKRRGGHMPSFGGPVDRPSPGTTKQDDKDEPEYVFVDRDLREKKPYENTAAEYTTRNAAADDLDEGQSLEYVDANSTLEGRIRAMEEERQRVLQRLDRITGGELSVYGEEGQRLETASRFRTAEIRSGIIWSEILSPPKAKRRRKGV